MGSSGQAVSWLGVVAVLIAATTLFLCGKAGSRSATDSLNQRAVAVAVREQPIKILPVRSGLMAIPADEIEPCYQRISPPAERSHTSYYLHVLRLHGLAARFDNPELDSSAAILNLFTNQAAGREFFGGNVLSRTRHGVAFLGDGENLESVWKSSETHRDQILAALAELGVPRAQSLQIGAERFALSDAVRDSIANFHVNQRELQWTALAYALYLPPQTEWSNKFGETCDFDQLVQILLELPLWDSSCAGSHLVYTWTILYRVDKEQYRLLSDGLRKRLADRIREFADSAVATQAADGSWGHGWFAKVPGQQLEGLPTLETTDLDARLLTTSHLAEWMLYLPESFSVPDDVLRRAGLWLLSQIREKSQEAVSKQICPCTHAACVVRILNEAR